MQLIEILKDSIKIDSSKNEKEIFLFYEKILISNGFNVSFQKVTKNRFNLFAEKNKTNGKAIMFYGHMDTVENTKGWKKPLEPVQIDNKIYGLGSYDMKGGIASFIKATESTKKYIKIFLAVGEEKISDGAWHAYKKNKKFFSDIELIISAEPNFGNGIYSITNGRTGRIILEIVSRGKSVHIAKKNEGIDAIKQICDFINLLYQTNFLKSEKSQFQIRKIKAEANGMSVCDNATAEIELLLDHKDKSIDIFNTIKKINKNQNIEIKYKQRKTPYLDGYLINEFPHQKSISYIIYQNTGKEMKLIQRISVGDDNVFGANEIPVITWGPDGNNAHSIDEYVDINSLEKLSKMYRELLDLT